MKDQQFALSRPFAVADIPARGLEIALEADSEERAKIATEFELPAVLSLKGTYRVTATKKGVHVEGRVNAHIRQICVVSLEPFEASVEEPVDLAFAQEPQRHKGEETSRGEITVLLEDEDPPEPIVGGKIDLGAVTLEFLALGLDPYPRKPGVELAREVGDVEKPASPFAALANYAGKSSDRK